MPNFFPLAFTYSIEILITLVASSLFFLVISFPTFILLKRILPDITTSLMRSIRYVYFGSFLVAQLLGFFIWRIVIEGRLVHEADSWVPFLTFFPLTWERIFSGISTTFHEPLAPLYTTGQVSSLHTGIALLLITLSIVLPAAYLSKHRLSATDTKSVFLVGAVLFFMQVPLLGIMQLVTAFIG